MCSINGCFNPYQQIDQKIIDIHAKIAFNQKYRGPDSSNHFTDRNCTFFSNELKITNITNSKQPFIMDGLVVVFNGEIYNNRTLTNFLRGKSHINESHTETETILLLYKCVGMDLFKMINGMFAIAIFDTKTQKLILAKDRFGQKPLYYAERNNYIHFCTESRYLTHFVDNNISDKGLVEYLTFGISFNHIIEDIINVQPGSYVIFSNSGKKSKYYWNPVRDINYSIQLPYAIDQTQEILNRSIDNMIPEEVNYGSYISGGIDSAIVTKMLNLKNRRLNIFTSGLILDNKKDIDPSLIESDYRYVESESNEFLYSDKLSDSLNCVYNKREFSVFDLMNHLEKMINHLPGGPVMSTSFPLFYFSAKESKNFKVCFVGEGADELNSGYNTMQPENYSKNIPLSFIELSDYFTISELKKILSKTKIYLLKDIMNNINRDIKMNAELNYSNDIDNKFNKIRYFIIRYIFHKHLLEKADGMAMGFGPTELRMPYLDDEYVDFILTLPLNILRHKGTKKYLLHKVAENVRVPNVIIKRVNKQRTSLPYYSLFFNNYSFKKYVQKYLNNNSIISDILKISNLGEFIYNLNGKPNAHKRAWALLVLEMWLRLNYEKD